MLKESTNDERQQMKLDNLITQAKESRDQLTSKLYALQKFKNEKNDDKEINNLLLAYSEFNNNLIEVERKHFKGL